jgi:FtsH-binding integral membrane protein
VTLLAHGIGGVRDLPVPTWLFFWAAVIALVASFVLLGALWKQPLLERHAGGRPLPAWLVSIVESRVLRIVLQAFSAGLLVLVFLCALFGSTNPNENFTPTFIYVVFWLGLVPVQVLIGDVFRVLDPWRAFADAAVWLMELGGRQAAPLATLPESAGRYPAAAALFAFAALELTYTDPASPRALALAIALYSYVTFFAMAAFGRETWLRQGEAFSVYFGTLARIAPFARVDGRLVVRWPFTGLAGADYTPGTLAFLAVMLGSVGFDGFSRTSLWQNRMADIESPFVLDQPRLGELIVNGVSLLGLAAAVLLVAGAYLAAVAIAQRSVNARESLAAEFVLSLVPIALVYAVAHYFSLLVIQGQFAITLSSDPFGRGWDLFGTADFAPNLAPFSPNTIWYVQVAALVGGHIAGLAIAHDRAVTLFRKREAALRSQYAMLVLMVLYTVGGLWLLNQS